MQRNTAVVTWRYLVNPTPEMPPEDELSSTETMDSEEDVELTAAEIAKETARITEWHRFKARRKLEQKRKSKRPDARKPDGFYRES